ncbi:hypothetical protein LTR84_008356 [Exophiala bonariae]|uniref:ferric-chelate reductase (NADPH) n=1 Tax=Exophiala bonariae TaxID=1690606 RepID=A0AAV9MZZ1_9EURO|nr:hypothetical protein LTR84_008356 [Exophiala bonariae]
MAYLFLSLTTAQIEQRRKQLDQTGFYAWLTPIIILLAVYAYQKVISSENAQNPPAMQALTPLQTLKRRVSWTLNTTYIPEFGPLKVQLTGVVYVLWLLYLVFRNTGEDYMHLTKAFGHVAISQLPIQYLLSVKTAYSPITFATGLTHEKLNAYHRLLGRIIHGLLAAHAVMYMRFFIILDVLSKRIQHRDVRLGLAAFWAFNILGLLAVPPIRKRVYYKLFYRSHVALSAFVVPLLFFHVSYTQKYMLQAGVIWVVGGAMRGRASTKARVTCRQVQGTDLIEVSVAIDDKASPLLRATPGQHVYIQHKTFGPKNPFSIVDASHSPNSEKSTGNITLVVRNLKGPQTGFLAALATDKRSGGHEISIEGPYGESGQYLQRLLSTSGSEDTSTSNHQIVLVAGGVGATYTLPIYQALLRAGTGKGTGGVKFIWLVRSLDDTQWAHPILETLVDPVDIDIYVTRRTRSRDDEARRHETFSRPLFNKPGVTLHFSPQEGSRPTISSIVGPVLSSSSSPGPDPTASRTVERGERHMPRSHDGNGKLTVLSCGPPALVRDLRREVGRHVALYGRDVEFFEEQFGFGGS